MKHVKQPDSFRASSRWGLFVALDKHVLEAIDEADLENGTAGRADAKSAPREAWNRALRSYRSACRLRTIGYWSGALSFLFVMLLIIVAGIAQIPGVSQELMITIATVFTAGAPALAGLWGLLYWGPAIAVPSTRLSRHVTELERVSRSGSNGLDRPSTILIMRTSGRIARCLFRILTQKIINVGARPDFADDVARICENVMIRKPSSAGASYRGEEAALDEHVVFLREVVALVVLDRIELLDRLRTEKRRKMLLDTKDSAIREYLQPFHGETALRVVRQDVLPLLSIVIALIAVVLTIVLP